MRRTSPWSFVAAVMLLPLAYFVSSLLLFVAVLRAWIEPGESALGVIEWYCTPLESVIETMPWMEPVIRWLVE